MRTRARSSLILAMILASSAYALAGDLAIRGVVVDTQGQPIAEPTVLAVRELVDPKAGIERRLAVLLRLEEIRELPVFRAKGDAAGRFVLTTGNELKYRLIVVAPGFAPRIIRSVTNPMSNLRAVLERGVVTEGVVVDRGGAPVSGAAVAIGLAVPGSAEPDIIEHVLARLLPPIWTGVSSRDGTFRCPYGQAGQLLTVLARKSGFQEGEATHATGAPIRVELEPGLRLHGVVLDPSEAPLADAEVRVTYKTPGRSTPMGLPMRAATTAADGSFEVDGLPPGEHRIVVHHPDFNAYRHGRFRVTEKPARFRLVCGRDLRVTVRDAVTSEVIPGASVRVEEEKELVRTAITNDNGLAVIHGIRPSGQPDLALTVVAPGYAMSAVDRWKISSQEAVRDVRLYRSLVVSGQVVDEAGLPVSGAIVFLQESVGSLKTPAGEGSVRRTGADGSFTFDGLAPKKLFFYRVTHEKYLDCDGEPFLTVPGVVVEPARLILLSPLSISGTVRDANGRPIAGAKIGVRGASNLVERVDRLAHWASSNPDGKFRINGLATGRHRLLVQADGYRERRDLSVELGRGTSSGIDIDLREAAVLTGMVVDSDGNPVAGAEVVVIDTTDGFQIFKTESNADGEFRMSDLGGSPVTVKVEREGVGEARVDSVSVSDRVVIRLR